MGEQEGGKKSCFQSAYNLFVTKVICRCFPPVCALACSSFLGVFLRAEVFLILMRPSLPVVAFIDCAFSVICETSLSDPRSHRFFHGSLRSFIVLFV